MHDKSAKFRRGLENYERTVTPSNPCKKMAAPANAATDVKMVDILLEKDIFGDQNLNLK